MNAEKNEVNDNLKGTIPVQTMIYEKQLENIKYFKYLGSMITNDARCSPTLESKSRTAMAKATLNRMNTHFTSKLGLSLR